MHSVHISLLIGYVHSTSITYYWLHENFSTPSYLQLLHPSSVVIDLPHQNPMSLFQPVTSDCTCFNFRFKAPPECDAYNPTVVQILTPQFLTFNNIRSFAHLRTMQKLFRSPSFHLPNNTYIMPIPINISTDFDHGQETPIFPQYPQLQRYVSQFEPLPVQYDFHLDYQFLYVLTPHGVTRAVSKMNCQSMIRYQSSNVKRVFKTPFTEYILTVKPIVECQFIHRHPRNSRSISQHL